MADLEPDTHLPRELSLLDGGEEHSTGDHLDRDDGPGEAGGSVERAAQLSEAAARMEPAAARRTPQALE